MNWVKFELPGKPVAQGRPRFSGKERVRVYNDQREEMLAVKTEVMSQMREKRILRRLAEPIAVRMVFHFTPATHLRRSQLWEPRGLKPDIDNLAKFYLDVMNDLVYDDDRYVTSLWCEKVFSDKMKTEIYIKPIEYTPKKTEWTEQSRKDVITEWIV